MKTETISVTKASRNFADCVNRANSEGITFILTKNGLPVARLVPEKEKVCLGRDLAQALSKMALTEDEARAWRRDLQISRAIKPK